MLHTFVDNLEDRQSIQLAVSRASAAALSAVLRTTHAFLWKYTNIRFSGNCQTETPQPISMKFCIIDYVLWLPDVPKLVRFGLSGPAFSVLALSLLNT
jgi:hypothetical protein